MTMTKLKNKFKLLLKIIEKNVQLNEDDNIFWIDFLSYTRTTNMNRILSNEYKYRIECEYVLRNI